MNTKYKLFQGVLKSTFALGIRFYAELHKMSLSFSYHKVNVICFHFKVVGAENDITEMQRHYSNIVIFHLTCICQHGNSVGILCNSTTLRSCCRKGKNPQVLIFVGRQYSNTPLYLFDRYLYANHTLP